jgi:hypothetical protein
MKFLRVGSFSKIVGKEGTKEGKGVERGRERESKKKG